MDKKTRPIYMPPQIARQTQTKSKRMKKDISCKWKRKKSWVAILTSSKIDIKIKAIRDKEGHYIIIQGAIQKEDITLGNITQHPT